MFNPGLEPQQYLKDVGYFTSTHNWQYWYYCQRYIIVLPFYSTYYQVPSLFAYSGFSQTHKIGNIGIIVNFVFP